MEWLLQAVLKNSQKSKEGKQEATASLAAANRASMDAAVTAVWTELDGIFGLEDTKWHVLCEKDVFTLLLSDLSKSFVENRGPPWFSAGMWLASANKKPPAVPAWLNRQ